MGGSATRLNDECFKLYTMHIVVHQQLTDIDAALWNKLVTGHTTDNNPFLRHEFLNGLELTQCVCAETGWRPQHIALYSSPDQSTLLAAMPCYIKDHSYGEYIFDWAWVNAYHRHGIEYYPKLSNAVPFTPATGPRILLSDDLEQQGLTQKTALDAIVKKAIDITEQQGLSSFHSLFNTPEQAQAMQTQGLLKRHSTQFHWQNRDYQNFDDFLAGMSSKKRKNIKRERRRVLETGIDTMAHRVI